MKNKRLDFKNTDQLQKQIDRIQPLVFSRFEKDKEFFYLDLLNIGLLNRTYELVETSIWALKKDRPQTTAHMLRGLIETLAFIYYWASKIGEANSNQDKNELVKAALFGTRDKSTKFESINILSCLKKAKERFPNLEDNYKDVCELVHPNSSSHFHFLKATREGKSALAIIPFYEFKEKDRERSLNQIGECAFHIINIAELYLVSISQPKPTN